MPRALDPSEETEPASSPDSELVVVPSPNFTIDPRQPANLLGARDRLSQGILMPLFPSMSGQLNAIAREFNFPNTLGISLYCKVITNGTTMSPRISEYSWKYLCSLLPTIRSNPGTQEMVTIGSIEFDIDLNKAAWMNEWVSGTVQNTAQPTFSRFTHFTSRTSTNFVDNSSPLTSRTGQVATQTPPPLPMECSPGHERECQQSSSHDSPLCPAPSACSDQVTAANDTETNTERLVTHRAPGVPAKAPIEHSGFELYPEYSSSVFSICSDANSRDKEKITINLPSRFPWLYVYRWVYPYITPYPEICAEVTAPGTFQTLSSSESLPEQPFTYTDPPVYPWNVLHIYPQMTIGDCCITAVEQTNRPLIDAFCTFLMALATAPKAYGPIFKVQQLVRIVVCSEQLVLSMAPQLLTTKLVVPRTGKPLGRTLINQYEGTGKRMGRFMLLFLVSQRNGGMAGFSILLICYMTKLSEVEWAGVRVVIRNLYCPHRI
ncbi:hypothetical protein SCLCIDRAFT_7453 [Scleroderma citrinum Foug A]|uniref:Uncharacterized protein n=1 Tax=Scleroderma citrinum Foug A TaxID=1036808 RepID=A0A0C3ASP3_9AGAM|nr:hypothetical protein SCLCIDRAFT_7453 [Scleroderma citrinum Foug A]